MKKTLYCKLLLIMFLLLSRISYGEDIFKIDFSNSLNKGYWGNNSDLFGITDWTLDVSQCTLSDDADYVKVVGTSGGRFEAVDCDGEAVWESRSIDISSFSNCSISILASETGSSTSSSKYIQFFYILDNNEEIPFRTNGDNIGNWGSVTASETGINGDSLVLVVKMNNSLSSNKVYFDDINITGDPKIVPRENLTEIREISDPITSQLIDTKINTSEKAISCLKFKIDETNQATDGNATKIKSITFFNAHPERAMNWDQGIGGVILFSDDKEIKPLNVFYGNDSIQLNFDEGVLDIPDGGNMEFDLRCYLNSKNTLHEGEQIQFGLKGSANGIETFISGSGISKDNQDIFSALYSVEVKASQLIYLSIPDSVFRSEHFSITAAATDDFGNKDIDCEEWIDLSLLEGADLLKSQSPIYKQLIKGQVQFDSLSYLVPDTIRLVVKTDNLDSLVSHPIIILNTRKSFATISNWSVSDTVISALRVSNSDALEVFRFSVVDSGKDSVSTFLKKIRIIPSVNNQVNWKKSIAAFILKREEIALDVSLEWTDKYLDISFPESEKGREIGSEDSVKYSIVTYLKSGETIDQQIFQMEIDSTHQEWEIDKKGSDFRKIFNDNLTGPQFICDVQAEKMNFVEVPERVDFKTAFILRIQLIDKLGNQDSNGLNKVKLSIASGMGEISSEGGLEQSINNGEYNWSDLTYSKAENFTILAESPQMESILTDNISGVDHSSFLAIEPTIADANLSSLAIDSKSAVPIFSFKITDDALHDTLPTIVNSMKFYKKKIENTFDWKKHIVGAVLKLNGEIIASTNDIKESYIRFYDSKEIVAIPNNSEKTYQLCIYFRKSQLPDNESIQVYIPMQDFNWGCTGNSSQFTDVLKEELHSDVYFIETKASQVSFSKIPFCIKDSTDIFDIKVTATDKYHNKDENINSSIRLEILQDNVVLKTKSNNWNLIDGFLGVDSLSCNANDTFNLCIYSNYASDTCTIYLGDDDCQIDQNFEDQNLDEWINIYDWKISSYKAIDGDYSLKHNLTNQASNSYISRELKNWKPETGATQWSFVLKNGDWDPSSSNYFLFHLVMDDSNPGKANSKYTVGVNLNGGKDLLSLWKTESNDSQLLIASDFDWNANETVAVQINYTAKGNWELKYNRLGNKENWILAGCRQSVINAKSEKWFSGLQFTVGSPSRAGDLWLDDLKIQHVNTAPFTKHFEIRNQDSIVLTFSEPIDSLVSLKNGNFDLRNQFDEAIEFKKECMVSNNSIALVLKDVFQTGSYKLLIRNIIDLDGAILKSDKVSFDYNAPVQLHDVVINEVMADPSPSVGLPDYEYVELYNTTEHPISMANWKLKFGGKESTLFADTIPAQGYIILCSNAATESLSAFGKVSGVSNFSNLTNFGGSLEIFSSATDQVIDQINYSESWYKSPEKREGGWSLERIDPMNTCSTFGNWSSSISETGGTPGQKNSVYGENLDKNSSIISSTQINSDNEIVLDFSEYMDSLSLKSLSNYTLQGNTLSQININSQQSATLSFSQSFEDGTPESLQIKNLSDECGNVLDSVLQFTYHKIHTHDVVINEVMADPSPSVGLPDYEYVELYNTTEHPISIANWKLNFGDKESTLFADTIPTQGYIILCSNVATESLSVFGKVSGVSNFPNLTNSGGSLEIFSSATDQVIDQINYSESWYKSPEKREGGWSLERIDPMNVAWQETNWSASVDNMGGTPGKRNSNFASNIDENPPVMENIFVHSKRVLHVQFNEPVGSLEALNVNNYKLSDLSIPIKVLSQDTEGKEFELIFEKDFIGNQKYTLHIEEQVKDLANYSLQIKDYDFWIPTNVMKGDIIINELLFNPYPGGVDYVELWNISDNIIDLSTLEIASRDDNFKIQDSMSITSNHELIHPQQFVLLTTDSINICENYFTCDPNVIHVMNKMPVFNDFEGRVILISDDKILEDFAYSEKMHFQLLTSVDGVALERINPDIKVNNKSNWQSAAQNIGFGTPGLINSSYQKSLKMENRVSLSSKSFSPDNDGANDKLFVNFNLDNNSYLVNIRIYNSIGKEIRKLASNLNIAKVDQLSWDGLSAGNERLPIGVYLLYIEIFNTNGDVKTYKKPCVLSGKLN